MHHYSLSGYGRMLADPIRLPAYRRALAQVLRPGAVVADLGTGTGVMALIACRLGAGHVYAIEPNDAIWVAREVAAANGLGDRITFFQECSEGITPPRRCDVVLSDLRGCLPLFEQHLPTLIDARERWLAPGGALIPQRDVIRGALVSSAKTYEDFAGPWRHLGTDIDMEAARTRTINTLGKCHLTPDELRSEPQRWAEIDYRTVADPHCEGRLHLTVTRGGPVHGVVLWFDAELVPGIGFSNAPGAPKLSYGQYFFPFQEPLPAAAGDSVSIFLRARLIGEDYVWQWTTAWSPADATRARPVRYQQSSFLGTPLSPERLRRSEAGHRPSLGPEGRRQLQVLAGMNGQLTLEELAARLAASEPQHFPDLPRALAYVREISLRLSE